MSSQYLSHTPFSRAIITLLALLFLLPSAFSATFVVNDLGDASDANPGDGIAATSGGVATLRAAIEEANALAGEDTITFDPTLFASPQTILLSQKLTLSENASIVGPGADKATLDAQTLCQIFYIANNINAYVSGLTMTNGYSSSCGGAVYISPNGFVDISDCILSNNEGYYGGGAVFGDSGDFSMKNCQVLGNITVDATLEGGGGVMGSSSLVTLDSCLFVNNNSVGNGGGIGVKGNLTMIDCKVENNNGSNGAGVYSAGPYGVEGTFFASGCEFSGNIAKKAGGGLCIASTTTSASVLNCTFYGNTSKREGGGLGIYTGSENIQIINCTILANQSDSDQTGDGKGGGLAVLSTSYFPNIGNTIIAGNTDRSNQAQDVGGTVVSLGGNLIGIGDGSTGFTGTDDQVGTTASPIDAKLGPLQDNGGPTLTCMPQADSPAINAGLNALITNPPFDGPPFYDQRGPDFARIYEDIVDIGAVEVQGPPDTTPPTLTLLGDPAITLECGTPFTDPGASAEDDIDGDISADIQVTGTVDSATPSEYTLTYNVSDSSGNPATPVSRAVTVEDTTPPEITLIGDPLVSHECHTPYTDAGATAADTCDTALPAVTIDTSAVNTDVPGTYIVNFSISDAAGNSAPLVSRTVQVTDTLPPTITLVGDNPLTIQCLSTYTDPGATASDDCDAALPAVTIDTSALDPNATGTYTVTYSVTDASGNPAPLVSRTVIVEGSCIAPNHTADQNADYVISLSELLRVIQFFNSGGFHCQTGTEDGYAPGPESDKGLLPLVPEVDMAPDKGLLPLVPEADLSRRSETKTDCAPHASAYNTHDWVINLSELLRLIQFFNTGGYHPCPGSEDNFCPAI